VVAAKRKSLLESLVLEKCASLFFKEEDEANFPKKLIASKEFFDCFGGNGRGFGPRIPVSAR
jgi:hypothetical protein